MDHLIIESRSYFRSYSVEEMNVLNLIIISFYQSEVKRGLRIQGTYGKLVVVPFGTTNCIGSIVVTGASLSDGFEYNNCVH